MPGYFSVKGFERFQHYKDRTPPWIKLYNELLDDYDFGGLPDASKMHLVAIWLLASRYSNRIPYDAQWIARRINATDPVDLKILADSGFILPEQECSTMLAERKQSAMPEKEREEEGEKDSEPIGSADTELKERLFGDTTKWLAKGAAISERTAKSFIGLCIRDHGEEDTLNAAIVTHKAQAPDPRAYMRAVLDKGGGNGKDFSMAAVLEEVSDEYRRESTGEPDHHDADGDTVRPAPPH